MCDPILFVRGEHDPVDMLAHFERRPQDQWAHDINLSVELLEFGTRQLDAVLISDRNALSRQVASMRARGEGPYGQLGPGVDLVLRDLDCTCALIVRPNCLCRHVSP